MSKHFKLGPEHLGALVSSINAERGHSAGNRPLPMEGHLETRTGILHAGFQMTQGDGWGTPGINGNVLNRLFGSASPGAQNEAMQALERGEVTDLNQIVQTLLQGQKDLQRAITSTTSYLPVRENLEADAIDLTPRDTPIRNLIPRVPGAGLATQWRQITALGGGWGSNDQPGGGSAVQLFFSETGAPQGYTETYANKSLGYKLMGCYGSITGFAQAVGNNFQNQAAAARTNSLRNFMLNEENALLNSSSTSTAAPWGDGTNALGWDGLNNLITTGNGVPSAQVVAVGGALTFAAIDAMLMAIYKKGGLDPYIICNATDLLSIVHLATQSGTVQMYRVLGATDGNTDVNLRVTGYIHPITGERVELIPSRFQTAGTMLFCCKRLPNGNPALDLDVLPQVNLPELAPNQAIQGYTMQDLAPALTAPQVYPWIITLYSVMRMKGAVVFGKLTGLTAV